MAGAVVSGKRQYPRQSVNFERDIPRLVEWLEARRIANMLDGRMYRTRFTTGHVNKALHPWYRKELTRRKEASPARILLGEAEKRGLVQWIGPKGVWEDIRHKATIGQVVRGAR